MKNMKKINLTITVIVLIAIMVIAIIVWKTSSTETPSEVGTPIETNLVIEGGNFGE